MNNQKRDLVSMVFITCCMERWPVRGLPFAAFNTVKLQRPLAANGIQRPAVAYAGELRTSGVITR